MSIALFCQQWPVEPWLEMRQTEAPDISFEVWPHIAQPQSVRMALCWKHQHGSLNNLPNLKCISSMGAGVDHLFSDPQLPGQVPVVRIIDENLTGSMFEYLLSAVGYYQRNFDYFFAQQQTTNWHRRVAKRFSETTITILGLGELGGYAARQFSALGFSVKGWSRRPKHIAGVSCYSGDSLSEAVADSEMVICLLPLTPETENILNARLFDQLNSNCVLINVARGELLNEQDLIAALEQHKLRGAMLDVFREEPLPKHHPFWQHAKIIITPHCSSVTDPRSAAKQIIENYRRLEKGLPLQNQVDPQQGY